MDNIDIVGPRFRVIEIPELPPGDTPAGSYAYADIEDRVIWLWSRTPRKLKEHAIARAMKLALDETL